jgi:hypothetical protein
VRRITLLVLTATRNDCERDAANLIRAIGREQRAWASRRGVEVDGADLTEDVDANLFTPVSHELQSQLTRRSPGLLGEREKAGEMAALCSTAALVHNVFAYWCGRAAGPVERALGETPSEATLDLRFAAAATRADTNAVHRNAVADALLQSETTSTVVAASFLEPYSLVDNRPEATTLEEDAGWCGLESCRNLALDLRANPRRFRHLAAARLLALGKAWTREAGPRGFRLLYLWWDGGGAGSARVRREIDRFRMRAGGELHFVALSWQELFGALRGAIRADANAGGHDAYLQYLSSRYF